MSVLESFRARVLAGEFLAGSWANLGSSLTAEMAVSPGSTGAARSRARAWKRHHHPPPIAGARGNTSGGVGAHRRNDPARFKRVLDAGAHGVMIPYVGTAAEAQAR